MTQAPPGRARGGGCEGRGLAGRGGRGGSRAGRPAAGRARPPWHRAARPCDCGVLGGASCRGQCKDVTRARGRAGRGRGPGGRAGWPGQSRPVTATRASPVRAVAAREGRCRPGGRETGHGGGGACPGRARLEAGGPPPLPRAPRGLGGCCGVTGRGQIGHQLNLENFSLHAAAAAARGDSVFYTCWRREVGWGGELGPGAPPPQKKTPERLPFPRLCGHPGGYPAAD